MDGCQSLIVLRLVYTEQIEQIVRAAVSSFLAGHQKVAVAEGMSAFWGATMMRILNAWTRLMAARSPACALLTLTTHGRTAQPSSLPSPAMSMAIRWCLRRDGGTSSAINGLPPWVQT